MWFFIDYKELDKKLKNIKKIDREIQVIHYEIQYLEEGLFRKSSFTNTKVTESQTKDIGDVYVTKTERKEKLLKRIEGLMAEREPLVSLIDDKLEDPEQRAVLKMFFCSNKNFY